MGRPLDQVAGDVSVGLDQWYERLDDAWEEDGWPGAIQDFRSEVAGLIGAGSYDSVVPKTSAGQGLRAVLNALPQPVNVVSTRGEFDSIDFILKTYVAKGCATVTWVEGKGDIPMFSAEDIVAAIGPDTHVVATCQAAPVSVSPRGPSSRSKLSWTTVVMPAKSWLPSRIAA